MYLIDDIFSAVDIPVGIHVYKKCIQVGEPLLFCEMKKI
jgi:hypothetical protein